MGVRLGIERIQLDGKIENRIAVIETEMLAETLNPR
jgi:hypothetical protein